MRRTDKDCGNCEGVYHRDGHELYCPQCGYTPDPPTDVSLSQPYETWHERDEENGRVRCAGGYVQAYWGNGAYSYDLDAGAFTSP